MIKIRKYRHNSAERYTNIFLVPQIRKRSNIFTRAIGKRGCMLHCRLTGCLNLTRLCRLRYRDIQIDNAIDTFAITDCPDLSFYIYAPSIYIDHYHEYRRSISVARGSFKDVGSAMDGNNNRRERLCSPLS